MLGVDFRAWRVEVRTASGSTVPVMDRIDTTCAILLLRQSGINASARLLRNWRLRGHITRTPKGYCPRELLAYVDRRKLA